MPGRGARSGLQMRFRGGRRTEAHKQQFQFRARLDNFNNLFQTTDVQPTNQIVPIKTTTISTKSLAIIDNALCLACGKCVDSCPFSAILMTDRPSIDTSICKGCGRCIAACPVSAISIQRI